MRTVFLTSTNPLYLSDLLAGEYIKYLSQKYQVVVFLPLEEEVIKSYGYWQGENIIYVNWRVQNEKFWIYFKLLRIAMIREFDFITTITNNLKIFLAKQGQKVKFLFLLSRALRFFGLTIKSSHLEFFERKFLPDSPAFNGYLEKYKPSLILTATPGFLPIEAEVIIWGKRKKIPTSAINFSWDNLSSNALKIRKPDYLIVWNEKIKSEAMKIHHYQSQKVFVSGILRYDPYFVDNPEEVSRENFLKNKNLDPALKTVLISTVPPVIYRDWPALIESLLAAQESGKIKSRFSLFVRLHPKDEIKNYQKLLNLKNVHVETASGTAMVKRLSGFNVVMNRLDLINLKQTLKYCDLNINYCSTITLEACLFDKPVINLRFQESDRRYYESFHYGPIVNDGAVRLADSEQELIELIDLFLADSAVDRLNRKTTITRYIGYQDGLSFKRSVDFLEKIINK